MFTPTSTVRTLLAHAENPCGKGQIVFTKLRCSKRHHIFRICPFIRRGKRCTCVACRHCEVAWDDGQEAIHAARTVCHLAVWRVTTPRAPLDRFCVDLKPHPHPRETHWGREDIIESFPLVFAPPPRGCFAPPKYLASLLMYLYILNPHRLAPN